MSAVESLVLARFEDYPRRSHQRSRGRLAVWQTKFRGPGKILRHLAGHSNTHLIVVSRQGSQAHPQEHSWRHLRTELIFELQNAIQHACLYEGLHVPFWQHFMPSLPRFFLTLGLTTSSNASHSIGRWIIEPRHANISLLFKTENPPQEDHSRRSTRRKKIILIPQVLPTVRLPETSDARGVEPPRLGGGPGGDAEAQGGVVHGVHDDALVLRAVL